MSSGPVAAPTWMTARLRRQLGEPLAQDLDVGVLGGALELDPDLGEPGIDLRRGAGACDEHRRVIGDHDAPGAPERLRLDVLERQPGLLGDHLAAGERGEIVQVGDPAMTEARRPDGHRLQRPVLVVLHEQAERGPLHLLGEDDQRPRRLHHRVERRHQVLDVDDRLVREQDVGVVEDRLHPLGVLDQIRGEVAVLDVHALHELDLDPGHRRLLDRDHALGADAVQRLGDGRADPLILLGGDRRHVREVVLAVDRPRAALQLGHDQLGRVLDPAAQQHRVGALVERLHALAHDRLREKRRGRRAVAGQVARLVGDLADELRAHVLERVRQLDLPRDRDAVVGDHRCAGQPLEHDVAALGPERHADGVGELVDSRLQQQARFVVEVEDLAHLGDRGLRRRRGSGCRGPGAGRHRGRPSRR